MNYRVTVRFYEELNDFLRRDRRKRDIEFSFDGRRSVKDLIESFGVPHVEVDLVLVNGESVGFDYIVADGDRISVYPVFESLDIRNVTRLRPEPLRDARFVLDVHLRKLAHRLRLLGFDAVFDGRLDDPDLAGPRDERHLLEKVEDLDPVGPRVDPHRPADRRRDAREPFGSGKARVAGAHRKRHQRSAAPGSHERRLDRDVRQLACQDEDDRVEPLVGDEDVRSLSERNSWQPLRPGPPQKGGERRHVVDLGKESGRSADPPRRPWREGFLGPQPQAKSRQ